MVKHSYKVEYVTELMQDDYVCVHVSGAVGDAFLFGYVKGVIGDLVIVADELNDDYTLSAYSYTAQFLFSEMKWVEIIDTRYITNEKGEVRFADSLNRDLKG